jgi:hypothetical protein
MEVLNFFKKSKFGGINTNFFIKLFVWTFGAMAKAKCDNIQI